ncbi:MAG: sulfotransferase family protein, partial [Bacteroidia bacterium]
VDLMFEQIKIFSLSHPWVGWEFDIEKTKNKIIEIIQEGPISYGDLCKTIYKEFRVNGFDKSSSSILIDKNPAYTLFADKLAQYFPEAKFIWLVRDYRANVLSRKQNAYLKSPKVPYNAIRWKIFNMIAYRFYKKNKEKVLLLRYEDLVNDHDASMRKVFSFLNVNEKDVVKDAPPAEMNTSGFEISSEHKKYFAKKYSDLGRPINSGRVNAWQTELSKKEITECDAICADFASVFGYKKYVAVSLIKKLGIRTKNFFIITTSYLDIKKDQLLFFVPAKIKMKQLIKRHSSLGFIKSGSLKGRA